jgi:putative flippase GtrA
LRFAVVGVSGVLVNEAVFAVTFATFRPLSESTRLNVAAVAGFVVSVAWNFWLNSRWTWGDRPKPLSRRAAAARAATYLGTALAALGVQMLVLHALAGRGVNPLLANLVGIGAATAVNFTGNHWLTFRPAAATAASKQEQHR